MNRLLFTLFIAIIAFGCSSTELTNDETNRITETFMKTKDAWNKGNIEEFMKGYQDSEELAFVGSAGPTYGYKATLERYKAGYPDTTTMGKLNFEILRLRKIDKHTALMIGKFHLTRTVGDADGYYTLVWQNKGDNWLIISDHSTSSAN